MKQLVKAEKGELNLGYYVMKMVKGGFSIDSQGGGNMSFPKNDWIEWMSASVFSTKYSLPEEDADILNTIILKKKKKNLIDQLKLIDSSIDDIQYLKIGKQPLVYVDYKGLMELIPLTQLGQGISRLFRFYSEMLLAESKIILIDEIENGIHHSALSLVWKGLAEIARKEEFGPRRPTVTNVSPSRKRRLRKLPKMISRFIVWRKPHRVIFAPLPMIVNH